MSVESPAAGYEGRPRFRWLNKVLVLGGPIVLALGVAVFVFTIFREPLPSTPPPKWTPPAPKQPAAVKLDPAARRVAGRFILTAVARKDVGASWSLVHPSMRAGYSKREWANGEIPIQPYPIERLDEARFHVVESFKNSLLIEVALIPEKGAEKDVRPAVFRLGLKAVGTGAKRHWLVDYWMPHWTPPVPSAP